MALTLENTVTDWREVLPIVKPFYERFFGEEMPELEGVVYGPKDLTKPNKLSRGAKATLNEYFIQGVPKYSLKYDVIGMPDKLRCNAPIDKPLIAQILLHELVHRYRKENMTSFEKLQDKILFLVPIKKYYFDLLLEECIATTSEFCFYLSHQRVSYSQDENAKSKAINLIEELEEKLDNHKSTDEFDRTLDSATESAIQQVSKYLAIAHHSDPDLWQKLKSLRTINDLKELVERE